MKQMQHLQHKPKKTICQQKKQLGSFGVKNGGQPGFLAGLMSGLGAEKNRDNFRRNKMS